MDTQRYRRWKYPLDINMTVITENLGLDVRSRSYAMACKTDMVTCKQPTLIGIMFEKFIDPDGILLV